MAIINPGIVRPMGGVMPTRPGAIRPVTTPTIRPQVGPIRPNVTLPTRSGRRFLRGGRYQP